MKKPRFLYAQTVLKRYLDDPGTLQKQLNGNKTARRPTNSDFDFLLRFLDNYRFKECLKILDTTTTGTTLNPLVSQARPVDQSSRDCLVALSDAWEELEPFVMRTSEKDESEAHELYDLLADPHLREVLVAYDDVANFRYDGEDYDISTMELEEFEVDDVVPGSNRRPLPAPSSFNHFTPVSKVEVDSSLHAPDSKDASLCEVTALSSEPGELTLHPVEEELVATSESEDEVTAQELPPSQQSRPISQVSERKRHPPSPQVRGAVRGAVNQIEASIATNSYKSSRENTNNRTSNFVETAVRNRRSSQPTQKLDDEDLSVPVKTNRESHLQSSGSRRSKPPLEPLTNVNIKTGSNPESLNNPIRGHQRTSLPRSADPTSPVPNKRSSRNLSAPVLENEAQKLPRDHRQNDSLPRSPKPRLSDVPPTVVKLPPAGQSRLIKLRRDHPSEALGITLAARTPSPPPDAPEGATSGRRSVLTIQRIMAGSLADRNGHLFPGDVLLEFNGRPVSTLEEALSQMGQSAGQMECQLLVRAPHSGLMTNQLVPASKEKSRVYIRCFFDYDHKKDSLCPTGNVGLTFKSGDVLELVNAQDPNWWQVRPLNDPHGKARLIPSATLEERRQAFNQEKLQDTNTKKSKRKVKTFFRAAEASELRLRSDIWSYEEVVPWPQTMVPCLLLIGANGVGRRTLKVMLARRDPKRFSFPISDTTDASAPVNIFRIIPKTRMEADVRAGAYVEWGKVGDHLYGIRFAAIREIIASGRTAVFDCQVQSVHLLHQPEFNPHVVFIHAPNFEVAKIMMQRGVEAGLTSNKRTDDELRQMIDESQKLGRRHRHLYSHSLVNENMEDSVKRLTRLVNYLESHSSWIPAGWAYELSIPPAAGGRKSKDYIPGSCSLSALGIQGLPPGFRSSLLARSVLSGVSEASDESASRMARPPSIISGISPSQPAGSNGRRLYEKRRRPGQEFQPLSPAIIEQDTPTESFSSTVSNAVPPLPSQLVDGRKNLSPSNSGSRSSQRSRNPPPISNHRDSKQPNSSTYGEPYERRLREQPSHTSERLKRTSDLEPSETRRPSGQDSHDGTQQPSPAPAAEILEVNRPRHYTRNASYQEDEETISSTSSDDEVDL